MERASASPKNQHDIIYALRTAQQHHVQLSQIADQKANIILGSFLVFITITQGILKNNMQCALPIWLLTIAYSISAIFALMVITPRFREKRVSPDSKPGNLLFFGSFARLSQDDYINMLNSKLQTNHQAREMLMKDIYQIGKVLQKKYTNLRLSYFPLALGIVASLIAFGVVQLT
jgi:hypothetical protein